MADERLTRIAADPRYHELLARRARFTGSLTAVMLIAYFGFVLIIAFDKALLARPVAGGVTSVGIPVGLGVIILAVLLTGLYVRRANRVYDGLIAALVDEAGA